jgi:hypothetical protein
MDEDKKLSSGMTMQEKIDFFNVFYCQSVEFK